MEQAYRTCAICRSESGIYHSYRRSDDAGYYLLFDLLLAKETLGTARQNLTNANQLYEVAIAKRKMGQISENELLQLKLSALNAKAALTEAESDLNAKMFQLRAFLGVGEDEILRPVVPES